MSLVFPSVRLASMQKVQPTTQANRIPFQGYRPYGNTMQLTPIQPGVTLEEWFTTISEPTCRLVGSEPETGTGGLAVRYVCHSHLQPLSMALSDDILLKVAYGDHSLLETAKRQGR